MTDRIDLGALDDHRDAAQRAVAVLTGGSLVGLTGAGSVALLASATVPPALLAVAAAAVATPERRPPTLLLPDSAALADWIEPRTAAAQKLPGRVWPGPVRLACAPAADGLFGRLAPEAQAALLDESGRVTFQVADDPVIRSVLSLMAGPVALAAATAEGWASLTRGGDSLGLILDNGPTASDRPATIVGLDDAGWSVIEPGVVTESTLHELAGTILLFVCTGNTCRSPMAAAYCRLILAHHFGCTVADLPSHGFTVESAGVAASDGAAASDHAVTILREASVRGGLDPAEAGLSGHRSRAVTADLVRRADQILAMTWDHLDAVLARFPEAADRIRLLDPRGEDIPDPYGSPEKAYQATLMVILPGLQDLLIPILGNRPSADGSIP